VSNPLPDMLALTPIADGSAQQAAPVRNNFSAIQTAVNANVTALSGGTVGQVLQAVDASTVQWATLLQLVDMSQKYKVQFGSSSTVLDGSGLMAVTFPVAFSTALTMVVAINGDSSALAAALLGVRAKSKTGFSADFGASHAAAAARVDWLAIGY